MLFLVFFSVIIDDADDTEARFSSFQSFYVDFFLFVRLFFVAVEIIFHMVFIDMVFKRERKMHKKK